MYLATAQFGTSSGSRQHVNDASRLAGLERLTPPGYHGHAHFWQRALSRRSMGRTAAGAIAFLAGAQTWWPSTAAAAGPIEAAPRPIPGGLDLFNVIGLPSGPTFHTFFPAYKQEVSTITDFTGFVAAAEIQGTGTETNTVTQVTTTLTYDADMRFMDGVYVGVDGRTHKGTFGFIWLDLFTGQFAQQVHDFNPGIAPNGLFWTMPIPHDSVAIHLGQTTAEMHLDNLAVPDYHDIFNSLGATQPPVPPTPSTVSFDVRWQGKSKLVELRDTTNHFAGRFADSTATITWSATQPATHLSFASAPAASSTTVSGVIGLERNGVFFT